MGKFYILKKKQLVSLFLLLMITTGNICIGQMYVDYATFLGHSVNFDANYTTLLESSKIIKHQGHIYIINREKNQLNNFQLSIQKIRKFDSNNNLIFSRSLFNDTTQFIFKDIVIDSNNNFHVIGMTDQNFITTDGSPTNGGFEIVYFVTNEAGNILMSTLISSNGNDMFPEISIDEYENIYITGFTSGDSGLYTTDGSFKAPNASSNAFYRKYDINGNLIFSTIFGSEDYSTSPIKIFGIDNHAIIVGSTRGVNFPTTDNTQSIGNNSRTFITRFDENNNMIFSTILEQSTGNNDPTDAILEGTDLYITGNQIGNNFTTTDGSYNIARNTFYLAKFNGLNQKEFVTLFNNGEGESRPTELRFYNGHIAIIGTHRINNLNLTPFPTTDGSAVNNLTSNIFLVKYDMSNYQVVHAGLMGGSNTESLNSSYFYQKIMNYTDDCIYFIINSSSDDFPVTNNSERQSQSTVVLVKINSSNAVEVSTYLPIYNSSYASNILVDDKKINILYTSITPGNAYAPPSIPLIPYTSNGLAPYIEPGSAPYTRHSNSFIQYVKCLNEQEHLNDSILPSFQSACINGYINPLTGSDITGVSNDVPELFVNGALIDNEINNAENNYQWQIADNINGPWNNIQNATSRNFSPTPQVSTKYFRRITLGTNCCTDTISVSSFSTVFITADYAPEIQPVAPFYICPGSEVRLGGAPTVQGGTPPYTYEWDFGAAAVANPTVNPQNSTLYTLFVTDDKDCKQIGQNIVQVAKANAGKDFSVCAGNPIQIRATAIPQQVNPVYSWTPSVGLSCTDCPNPLSSTTNSTTYTLTLTFTQSNGETCITTDEVTAMAVAAPNNNFAGDDKTICYPASASLGTSPQQGYTYTWSPASNLSTNTGMPVTYDPGNSFPPAINPASYTVTAEKNGCRFTDNVKVYVIRANGGNPTCGPTIIGHNTVTSNLGETFQWSVISGFGNILGSSNVPYPSVTASPNNQLTSYQLTTTLNGVSCTSQAVVFPTCSDGSTYCRVLISTSASMNNCPNTNIPGNEVFLTANPNSNPDNFLYNWSPAIGLSSYNTRTVQVLTNLPQTYTVTITSSIDPNFSCSRTVQVNHVIPPNFSAQDHTVCNGSVVSLGQASVSGWEYLWTPDDGLFNVENSNPTFTAETSKNYMVRVRDISSGCITRDTARLIVNTPSANAGSDYVICQSGIVQLGTQSQPNTIYSWSPANASWQNGTNHESAQPEVLIATSLTFQLSATDTLTQCTANDEVNVIVDNNPFLPFMNDTLLCKGSGIKIGSPPISGVQYSWTPIDGLNNSNIAQPIASPNETTTYTLTATFPGCVSQVYRQLTIEVIDLSFTMPDISYCPSEGSLFIGTNAPQNMYSYSWQPSSGVSNPSVRNPFTSFPPPNTTTSYSLTVRDENGCVAQNSVTIIPELSPPIAGSNQTLCLGDYIHLGSFNNPQFDSISYRWSPDTYLSCNDCPSPIFSPENTGTYSFTLFKTNLNTNCVNSSSVTILVDNISLPEIENQFLCTNSCVDIEIEPSSGILYSWSPELYLSNPNIANPRLCPESNIVYDLFAQNINGCTDSAKIYVTLDTTQAPIIDLDSIEACITDSVIELISSVSPPANYGYTWDSDLLLSDYNSLNPFVVNPAEGSYLLTLTVININNGCIGKADALLNILKPPTDTVFLSICPELLPIEWNNSTIYESGIHNVHLNIDGVCDSIVVLSLEVLNSNDTIFTSGFACNESDSGWIYKDTVNLFGCNTVLASYINFLPADSIHVVNYTCTEVDDGINRTTHINRYGCDSVYISETIFIENDSTYNQLTSCIPQDTGTFVFHLFNQYGCDSTHISYISFVESDTVYLDDVTCDSLESGIHETTYLNQYGCDSLVITHFEFVENNYSVNPSYSVIRGGESFEFTIENEDENLIMSWWGSNGENCEAICHQYMLQPNYYTVYYYFILTDSITGCSVEDTLHIDVEFFSELNIPNIFTPNNDGQNDIYRVYGKDLMEFSLIIFDRWGGKIFETTDISQGWDGNFKGKPVGSGVYVGAIKATGMDAKKYEKTISIKLVR